jgi:hypothetical protein
MAKSKARSKRVEEGSEVLYLRIDPALASWLGDLAESTGRSRNELGAAVLEEFREVMRMVAMVENADDANPLFIVSVVGPAWVARLVSMGIASEAMKESWREWLSDQDRHQRILDADRTKGGSKERSKS